MERQYNKIRIIKIYSPQIVKTELHVKQTDSTTLHPTSLHQSNHLFRVDNFHLKSRRRSVEADKGPDGAAMVQGSYSATVKNILELTKLI